MDPLHSIQNIADSLRIAARSFPGQTAVAEPVRKRQPRPLRYRTIDFAGLDQQADRISQAMQAAGCRPGQRISLMIPPGIEFVSWVFGLMRSGVTTILIDPGMGKRNMVRCLAEAEPEGLVGILPAQILRTLFRSRFPHCKFHLLAGKGRWFGCTRVEDFLEHPARFPLPSPAPIPDPTGSTAEGDSTLVGLETTVNLTRDSGPLAAGEEPAEQPAAIIFTTGSTGPPKGVLYRHRHFIQQTIQIRDYFRIAPGGTDVSGFPLFALFNAGMGVTTVFPRMDPTRPASVDPLDIADAVRQFGADQSFGSPALWNTVATYAEKHGLQLPEIRRVLTAGAPVPTRVLAKIRRMVAPEAMVHTPYGATEALPVACIESREVLEETAGQTSQGAGTCVGRRWPGIRWQIIPIMDGPLTDLRETCPLATGEIGELIVSGPVVTDRYVTQTAANALHKVRDGQSFWHRMGDVGYLDSADRFWFCGRKNHRVICGEQTLFTIPCEAIFNQHPAVFRSALVGIGKRGEQTPVVVIETWPEHRPAGDRGRKKLADELLQLGQQNRLTVPIRKLLFLQRLPTDIRHNSKIFREKIAVWAARQKTFG